MAPGVAVPDDCRLSVRARCPLAWAPKSSLDADLTDRNLQALELAEGFIQQPAHSHESDDESHSDLLRVERKLDTALRMLAMIVNQQADRPATVDVEIGPECLQWPREQFAPVIGQSIYKLLIWLNPLSPIPIQLEGHLNAEQSSVFYFQLKFNDERLKEEWERMVFRWHRRSVAKLR